MTQTYAQIQKQIERLQKEAESIRVKEVAGVIDRIKVAIEHYGLTSEQLGFGGGKSQTIKTKRNGKSGAEAPGKAPKSKSKVAAEVSVKKYTDGNGNFWSGRGRFRPSWVNEALAAGKTLEDLLANGTAVGSPAKSFKVRAKGVKSSRASKVLYRDDAGNSWAGMGPRPRWLKQALDGGKTLDELKG